MAERNIEHLVLIVTVGICSVCRAMVPKLPTPKGLQMLVVYAVMAVISTITFALRVYVRSRMVKRSWEDWAAGIGWFVFIGFCGAAMVGPFYGTGQHADLIPPEKLPIGLRVRTPIFVDLG